MAKADRECLPILQWELEASGSDFKIVSYSTNILGVPVPVKHYWDVQKSDSETDSDSDIIRLVAQLSSSSTVFTISNVTALTTKSKIFSTYKLK